LLAEGLLDVTGVILRKQARYEGGTSHQCGDNGEYFRRKMVGVSDEA
jgi:hypothetical protein